MPAHEVITLQFGNFANYVGAHYWNFQDELLGLAELEGASGTAQQVNPDVLYRVGEDSQGQATYTPRLLLFDLSGSLGGVSASGSAPVAEPTAELITTWRGPAGVHAAQRVERSAFSRLLDAEAEAEPNPESSAQLSAAARALDSQQGVRYWTDFLKASLHPRSILQLPGLWHGVAGFAGFGEGRAALAAGGGAAEVLEAARDRIRLLAEECDHMQGFQCFVDDQSGFGGVALEVLSELRDDFPAATTLLFAVRERDRPAAAGATNAESREAALRLWHLNDALSLAQLSEVSSAYVPLAPPTSSASSLPALQWAPGSRFHASALCAAAVESMTTPYRLAAAGAGGSQLGGPTGATDMRSLAQLLSGPGIANLAAAAAALPCPWLPEEHELAEARDERLDGRAPHGDPRLFTRSCVAGFTPGLRPAPEGLLAESVVLRGPRRAGAPLPVSEAARVLELSLALEGARAIRHTSVAAPPLPIPLPFPHIFRPFVSRFGDVPLQMAASGSYGSTNGVAGNGGAAAGGRANGTGPSASHMPDVQSAPVLSRLVATSAFMPYIEERLQRLRGIGGSGQGRALLASWGYSPDELAELEDRLRAMKSAYQHDSDVSEDESSESDY